MKRDDYNQPLAPTQIQSNSPNSGNPRGILASIASGFFVLGLLLGGSAVYVFMSRQTADRAIAPAPIPSPTVAESSPIPSPTIAESTPPAIAESPTPIVSPSAPSSPAISEIQPGQFVQPAFSNKAEIELLKINRIPGQPNVVNIQFRVRMLKPDATVGTDFMTPSRTSARNPITSETYGSVLNKSSDTISLYSMGFSKVPSADAYVWMQIPDGVNTVDLYFEKAQVFKDVPIPN